MTMQKSRTKLDTLDLLPEDGVRDFGGLTGKKPMRSLGHVGPIEDDIAGDKVKKGAAAARFPRTAVKILKTWMIEHIDHPYPTEEEKEALKEETGLSISQISNWMANTRRRQKARPKRAASPSIRPSTEPMNIPAGRTWDDLSKYFPSSRAYSVWYKNVLPMEAVFEVLDRANVVLAAREWTDFGDYSQE